MKEIRAYIQPFMLPKLTQALLEIPNFPGISVSDCEGFGHERYLDKQDYTPYVPKKRIEIFVPDELVNVIYSTIMAVTNTHQRGAGMVYVINVDRSGRISTGEEEQDSPDKISS